MKSSLIPVLSSFCLLLATSCSLTELGATIKNKVVEGSEYVVEKSKSAYHSSKAAIGLGDEEPTDPNILFLKGKRVQGRGKP